MKKIMIITVMFLVGIFASQLMAQDVSVLVHDGVNVQVQAPGTVRVVPPGHVHVAPQVYIRPRHVPPPIAPKPAFRTPIRNGLWWAGVGIRRGLWHNRHWRYHRLERKLGPTVIIQPNSPYSP